MKNDNSTNMQQDQPRQQQQQIPPKSSPSNASSAPSLLTWASTVPKSPGTPALCTESRDPPSREPSTLSRLPTSSHPYSAGILSLRRLQPHSALYRSPRNFLWSSVLRCRLPIIVSMEWGIWFGIREGFWRISRLFRPGGRWLGWVRLVRLRLRFCKDYVV